MTITETLIAFATGIALLASPVAAGGPVLPVEEPAFVEDARPSSEGRWVAPVVIGLLVLCAIACGDGDDAPIGKPVDPCNGGC